MLKINPDRYARTPGSVLFDIRLTPEDKMVYGALAFKEKHGELTSGLRFIGDLFGISRNRVKRSMDRLVEFEHIAQIIGKRGDRGIYRLLAPAFNKCKAYQSGGMLLTSLIEKPNSVKCPKCKRECRQLLKAGWCRSCAWDSKVTRIARREIASSNIA